MLKVPLLFGGMSSLLLLLRSAELGASLMLLGSAVAVCVIAIQSLRHKREARRYPYTAGAIISDHGVLFNGETGPKHHPWKNFGEAFISKLNDASIIQHLAVDDLHLENYDRFSSYYLTPIDYLAMEPSDFLALLQENSNFPRPCLEKFVQGA